MKALFAILTIAIASALHFATPARGGEADGPKLRDRAFAITDEDRGWWSFQPIQTPPVPPLRHGRSVANEIDAFLLARLDRRNLTFNPPASRRELIRRAYFDLLGLPPTPEAVEAFESDPSPSTWERLIDDLLARPQYGERWARHWLDVVRFAETNGYERDGVKPNAWRYRDYVIQSLNQDKPYDRFLLEQLAGDELGGEFNPEAIVATGFYRLHVWDDEPDSTLAAEFDDLDDIMVTTGAAFLGLTLGCARCHDHKFDPVSQQDYYEMLAYFRSINPYGRHHKGGGGRGTGRITRPLAPPDEVARWEARRDGQLTPLREQLKAERDDARRRDLEAAIKRIESEAPPFGYALAIQDDPVQPTHILHRGDAHVPRAEVQPALPEIFGTGSNAVPARPTPANSAGRRLALARSLVDPSNPLTPRVIMNRLWQHHFGRGLVSTPNDFGRTGALPTHPELLDHLAADFVSGGWKLKRMHKRIMLSDAYRMSTRADRPEALAVDEGNDLLWRQNPRRMEAEVLRDSLLAISGSLNLKRGGPGVFPTLPREVHGTQDSVGKGWGESPAEEQDRRSIYLFVKRALVLPFLEVFDYTTTTVPVGARAVTTVAPQALMLLNDGFVQQQAGRFAARLEREAGPDSTARVTRAFALALQRKPTPSELKAALTMLDNQRRTAAAVDPLTADHAALHDFCVSLLNLNELLYVD